MRVLEATKNLKENQFNHYTLSTGHNHVQDMDKAEREDLVVDQIISITPQLNNGEKVFLIELDGERFYLEKTFDDDGYCLTIFIGKNGEKPLLSSWGVWDEAKADAQWKKLTWVAKKKGVFLDATNTKERPQAPFICDLLYPQYSIWQFGKILLFGRLEVDWTSDFLKVFATLEFKGYYKTLNQAG